MSKGIVIVICLLLIVIAIVSTYFLAKIKSSRLYTYIPTGTLALAIMFFYIKLHFISEGFAGIIDIVAIILLAFIFFISLVFAVILDMIYYKKTKNK